MFVSWSHWTGRHRPGSFLSSLQDESASSSSGDFDDTYAYGTATIDAGRQSAYLTAVVRGDTRLEDNETIKLVLSGAQNAVFADNAPALLASATIIDDDQGEPTMLGGVGDFGKTIVTADADDGPPKIDVISTSVNEGNSGGTWAFIHVLRRTTMPRAGRLR